MEICNSTEPFKGMTTRMQSVCNSCRLRFESNKELFTHYKSELHRMNLIQIAKHEPIITLEQYQTYVETKQAAADAAAKKRQEEEEDDQEEFRVELCREIPLTECLFSGQTFETPELALQHMRSYGFRFVYPERLEDPEGLMLYFGEKIGVGHCCIYCHRQFQSIKAVRGHMIGCRHCAYDLDEELDDYYRKETALAVYEGVVDDVGELHLPNGRVYGHRAYQRYYKQRSIDPEEFKKTARIAIGGPVARQSLNLATDAIMQRREYFKQKYISSRQRRLVTKDYHPFSDIHRGNA